MENKKQEMYVSWKVIILNSITTGLALSFLLSQFIWMSDDPESTGMMAIPFVLPFGILPPLVVLFLLVSVLEKPRGYINTRFVDTMFILPAAFVVFIEATLILSDLNSFDAYLQELYLFIPQTIMLIWAIFINHKFQIPENKIKVV